MQTRAYTPADYPAIASIWAARAFPALPPEALPANGIIVLNDRLIVAFGFLYLSDSAIAWTEWLTTNPEAQPAQRHEALDLIIKSLEATARAAGRRILFVSLADRGLISRFIAHGFQAGDEQMTNLTKVL